MIPFNVPDALPLTYGDRFDVPVLLRNGPAKKPRKQWRTAELKPWAGLGGFPATNGWYITTTTWREIIKAAVEVEPAEIQELSDDAQEEQRLTQRRIFREQQEEARPRLRPLLRNAYERGETSEWGDLLRRSEEPELDLASGERLLEAATPETYLAVSPYSLPSPRT